MREIKFRAKRIDNNKWAYGGLVQADDYCIIDQRNELYVEIEYNFRGDTHFFRLSGVMCDKTTIGQYTGLKDKSGKEIYEGDVIRSPLSEDKTRPHRIFTIPATQLLWGALVDRKELCYLRLDQDWIYKFGKEVIGNIHDNLELLKGGEQ